MSVTITFTFADAAEAAAYLMGRTGPVKPTSVEQAAPPGPAPKAADKPAKAAAKAESKPAPSAPAAVEYPVLQKAVFELAAKNKAKVMELIQAQGGRSFKELPAEEWAAALERVKAADAEINASAEVA